MPWTRVALGTGSGPRLPTHPRSPVGCLSVRQTRGPCNGGAALQAGARAGLSLSSLFSPISLSEPAWRALGALVALTSPATEHECSLNSSAVCHHPLGLGGTDEDGPGGSETALNLYGRGGCYAFSERPRNNPMARRQDPARSWLP